MMSNTVNRSFSDEVGLKADFEAFYPVSKKFFYKKYERLFAFQSQKIK